MSMPTPVFRPDDPNQFDDGSPRMDRVILKMWAEQDGTHSRIMIKVGDDPPMEYMKWEREWNKRGWSATSNPAEPVIDSAKDISDET